MRFLFLTDRFPPDCIGGHELRCQELAKTLRHRGHHILVLTSCESTHCVFEPNVWRVLNRLIPHRHPLHQGLRDAQDARWLKKAISKFEPEFIVVFGVFGLSLTLFSTLEMFGIPLIYDEGSFGLERIWKHFGPWPRFCQDASSNMIRKAWKRIAINVLSRYGGGCLATRKILPEHRFSYFNSRANRAKAFKSGVRIRIAEVIYPGVDLDQFPFFCRHDAFPGEVHLLVPGRIHPDKGQLVAVESLEWIHRHLPNSSISLRLIGHIQDERYQDEIREACKQLREDDQVEICPAVSREDMSAQYGWADLVLFPTIYEEPFARVPLEAMASGRPLIATATGGTAELIRDGQNALVFPVSNVQTLASCVRRLSADPNLYDRLACQGRAEVESKYDWNGYVSRVEKFLQGATMTFEREARVAMIDSL